MSKMRDVVDGAFAIANETHVMLAGGCHRMRTGWCSCGWKRKALYPLTKSTSRPRARRSIGLLPTILER